MKLTKLQRYTAYCLMLSEIEIYPTNRKYFGSGFCWMIFWLFGLDDDGWNNGKQHNGIIDVIELYFPELQAKKPYTCGAWFDHNERGWEQRAELLKQCIIETHP